MASSNIFDNPYYQAIIGGVGGLSQFAAAQSNAMNQPKYNIPSAPATGGAPSYNLGTAFSQANEYSPSHGHGMVSTGVGTGAQIGAGIGTVFGPVGTLLGGAAGAGVGAIAGLIGDAFASSRATDQHTQLIHQIEAGQNQFNKDQEAFDQNYLARQQYKDRIA